MAMAITMAQGHKVSVPSTTEQSSRNWQSYSEKAFALELLGISLLHTLLISLRDTPGQYYFFTAELSMDSPPTRSILGVEKCACGEPLAEDKRLRYRGADGLLEAWILWGW